MEWDGIEEDGVLLSSFVHVHVHVLIEQVIASPSLLTKDILESGT
jgi:hypothetical protein